jgi:hypothetical protein
MLDAPRQYHLLEPVQLAERARDAVVPDDPKTLARALVQRGGLTTYQAAADVAFAEDGRHLATVNGNGTASGLWLSS